MKKADTKEYQLKVDYINELIENKVFKEDMRDYFMKNISEVIEIRGNLVAIEKESINTKFCFSYGYSGVANEEEMKDAAEMSDYAKQSQSYFIEKNLERINSKIKELKVYEKTGMMTKYYGNAKKIKEVVSYDYETFYYKDVEPLTQEEIQQYLEALEREKERQIKRVNTYLKRYGLEHVQSWTYLSD